MYLVVISTKFIKTNLIRVKFQPIMAAETPLTGVTLLGSDVTKSEMTQVNSIKLNNPDKFDIKR